MKQIKLIAIFVTLLCTISCIKKDNNNITVMSFNIRYNNPNDGENSWSNRKGLVDEMLKKQQPSLLGTQEVTLEQLRDLEIILPNYTSEGVGRDDGKEKGEFSAVFYDKEKYKGLESGTFWLSESGDIGSIGIGAKLPRICTWAKLQTKKGDKQEFYLFNTHYSHVSDSARFMSSKVLMNKIQTIAQGKPTIITGDFNCDTNDLPIKEIIGKKNGSYEFSNAMDISETKHEGGKTTINGFRDDKEDHIIDFIFISQHFGVRNHAFLPLRKRNVFVSDHYPVTANLYFKTSD